MSKEDMELLNNLIDLLKSALPYLFSLLVVYFGYLYGIRQMRSQKRLEFVERQLREFYSPMIGSVKKLKAAGELRLDISNESDTAWRKICHKHTEPGFDHEKKIKPFEKSIMYNNKQLCEELIPLYDEMVSIFTKNFWLANSATRKWYSELYHFVDLWHRWLEGAIPSEVVQQIDHTEERLAPFYQDLENQLEELQKELSDK